MSLADIALVVSLLTGGAQTGGTAPAASTPPRVADTLEQPAQFDASRFDTVTAISLRSLLDTAVMRHLPTRQLVNKALEGAARHVNGKEILKVVRQQYLGMLDARAAMGDLSSPEELDAGADALRSGIDGRALVAIRATRPAGTAVTALVVITDIVKRGVPPTTARDAVTAISRMPNSDDSLLNLQVQVAKNAARGGPGMALEALERYVRVTVPGAAKPSAPAAATPPIRPNQP